MNLITANIFWSKGLQVANELQCMYDLGVMELGFFYIQLDIWSHFGGITAIAKHKAFINRYENIFMVHISFKATF